MARGSWTSSIGRYRVGLFGFPRVALVRTEPCIAARACGSAEADLAPSGRVGIIDGDDLLQQVMLEEAARRQITPMATVYSIVLDVAEQSILLLRRDLLDRLPVT